MILKYFFETILDHAFREINLSTRGRVKSCLDMLLEKFTECVSL